MNDTQLDHYTRPSGSSTITVRPQNGFDSTVALSASGLPSGVTASFSTSVTTTLSVTSGATTGTSGSLRHTTTLSLTVNAAAALTRTATPSSLHVADRDSDRQRTENSKCLGESRHLEWI